MDQDKASRRTVTALNRLEGTEFIVTTARGALENWLSAGRYAAAMYGLHNALQVVPALPRAKANDWEIADEARLRHLYVHFGRQTYVRTMRDMLTVQSVLTARQDAQAANDFDRMAGTFSAHLRRRRAQCAVLAPLLPDVREPFDVVLDRYSPGLRYADIRKIEQAILPLSRQIIATARYCGPDQRFVMPRADQKKLGLALMAALGVDTKRVQIAWDCGPPLARGYGNDVKIVVRTDTDDFIKMLTDVVHEGAGHAAYRQFRVPGYSDRAVGMVPGALADEVPPLLLEHYVARMPEFATFICDTMNRLGINPRQLTATDIHNRLLYGSENRSRVDSDARGYALYTLHRIHVVRDLVNGAAEGNDLTALWRRHEKALGLPANDPFADLLVFSGYEGYYGSYLPAMIVAADSHTRMLKDNPRIGADIAAGNFKALRSWLTRDIYKHGSRYNPVIDPAPYIDYMRRTYGDGVKAPPPRPQP